MHEGHTTVAVWLLGPHQCGAIQPQPQNTWGRHDFPTVEQVILWWDYWQVDKISHKTPEYWQGSGNFNFNVYVQFSRYGLYKPAFLHLHQNHPECLSAKHILGLDADDWIRTAKDGIQRSTVTARHHVTFHMHSSSIATGTRSAILCMNIPHLRYILGRKVEDMKFKFKITRMVSWPPILFIVSKQGVVAIVEIPCQELVTPRSQLLSRKPSKEKQPAGKLSNLTSIFCVVSAGSSSTSKKVMWQQEI